MYAYVNYPRWRRAGYTGYNDSRDEEPKDLKFHIDLVSDNRRESTDLYLNELLEVIKKVEKGAIIRLPGYLREFIDPLDKEWTGMEINFEEDDEGDCNKYITYYYIDKEKNNKERWLRRADSLYHWKLKGDASGKLHFIKCEIDSYSDYSKYGSDMDKEFYGELANSILDYSISTTTKAGREMYKEMLKDPYNNMDLFLNVDRKLVRVFLSHSMSGLSEKKVDNIRKKAMEKVEEMYKDSGIKIEFIDNFLHEDAPINAGRLWHLGRSIQQMEDADAIYFCENHMFGKGCVIERMIAEMYHLKILNK